MSQIGWSVFAGIRDQAASAALVAASAGAIRPVKCDVTNSEQIESAVSQIMAATEGSLDGLVNNAGIAVPGPLELVSIEEVRRQLEVNVIGQAAVTQPLITALRSSTGRIVNIGSVSGLFTPPMLGVYAMSKYAIEAFSDGLRRELNTSGISVSLIEPGSIDTPFWEKSRAWALPVLDTMSEEQRNLYGATIDKLAAKAASRPGSGVHLVVNAVEHALTSRRPKTRYPIGRSAQVISRLRRILPDRALDRLARLS